MSRFTILLSAFYSQALFQQAANKQKSRVKAWQYIKQTQQAKNILDLATIKISATKNNSVCLPRLVVVFKKLVFLIYLKNSTTSVQFNNAAHAA